MQAAHVGGQAGLEGNLVPWRVTARHRLLEIVVEEFVRIVLGGIARQVKEFDPVGMILQPGGDPAGAVDRQIVDDDEQLARGLSTAEQKPTTAAE